MLKFLIYKIIPCLILVCCVLIMTSSFLLKHPFGSDDNVSQQLTALQTNINNNNWLEASTLALELQTAWDKVVRRIQFSVERDEINNFQHSLARMKGYIAAQHRPGSLAELMELKQTWDDLNQ